MNLMQKVVEREAIWVRSAPCIVALLAQEQLRSAIPRIIITIKYRYSYHSNGN